MSPRTMERTNQHVVFILIEPCETLDYTFKQHSNMTGHKIHLDGGNSDPLTYFMPPNVAVKDVRIINLQK